MADDIDENRPLLKGSIQSVTIEDVLPDIIVVCLKHGRNVYRGILLDSVKRELPCGVNFAMDDLKGGYRREVQKNSVVCRDSETAITPSNTPEMSALVNRHTYTLSYKAGASHIIPLIQKEYTRPLRDKNVRNNMRLRPRQVLCMKCKQGIHDSTTKDQTPSKTTEPQSEKVPEIPKQQDRYETRKRKQFSNLAACEVDSPQKIKKVDNSTSKSSPIIKISFAGPRGQGTVVEIPSKPNIPSDYDEGKNTPSATSIDDEFDDSKKQKRDEYRKFRKAQKKAEKKIRNVALADSDKDSVNSENWIHTNDGPRKKKSKRAKHKLKRKHKHHDHDHRNGRHQNGQSETNESFKENTADCTILAGNPISDNENASSAVEDMVLYADGTDDAKSETHSLSKFREQNDDDNRDGIIVLSPRHNFMFDCDNIKMGTPSKQYDSNTETSQELDVDFPNLPDDFFSNSNKSSVNDSDTENNLSDAPFDLHHGESLDPDFDCNFGNVDERGSQGGSPLMMRIHNRLVNKVILDDDRIIRNSDVIWGKIHGFPWWPGRVISITESLKDSGVIINQTAQVSWFASSTMSHMPCSELYPFLQDFKLRFNKKKKGSYKLAVKQATMIAKSIAADLQNMTPELSASVDSV